MTENTVSKRKILAIKTRAIGDTVLLTGVLRLLRQHRPGWKIHVLVGTAGGELLENLPYVDRVIAVNEPSGKVTRAAFWMKTLRRLRDIRYDQVLNFHASFRTSLVSQLLRTELCVANDHDLKSKNRLSDLPVPGRGIVKSIIDRDLDVLRAVGISATVEEALPELCPFPFEKERAAELLKNESGVKCIFLGIGGSRSTKKWPAEHFVSLMKELASAHSCRFVITSVESDRSWLEKFWAALDQNPGLKGMVSHFEQLPIRIVAALLAECDVYVGNDSGLKHIAAAVGTPTYTFFGPEAPLEWHPYPEDKHKYFFLDELKCRTETGKHWCSIEECTAHEHRCMKEILPSKVRMEIEGLLRTC